MKNVRLDARKRLIVMTATMLALSGCLTPSEDASTDAGFVNPVDPGSSNSAPTIQGNPTRAITIGHLYTFVPSASDPDGDVLTFSVTNRPSWASFDTATGELSGQPTIGDEGTFANIIISVSDGEHSAAMNPYSIDVTQASLGSTTLTLSAPAVNTDGSPFMDLASYKLYFGTSRGIYPNEILINNPGISDYVVENLAPATYYFVATAINTSGMESAYSNEVSRTVN